MQGGTGKSMFRMLATVLVNTFVYLVRGLDPERLGSFTADVKEVANLASIMRSYTTITGVASKIVVSLLTTVMSYFEISVARWPSFMKPAEIDSVCSEYMELEKIFAQGLLYTEQSKVDRVIVLWEKMMAIQRAALSKKDTMLHIYTMTLLRKVEDWKSRIPPHMRGKEAQDRPRPAWIHIFGKPRIGKTSVVSKLLVYRCLQEMGELDSFQPWDNVVHNRNLGASSTWCLSVVNPCRDDANRFTAAYICTL